MATLGMVIFAGVGVELAFQTQGREMDLHFS